MCLLSFLIKNHSDVNPPGRRRVRGRYHKLHRIEDRRGNGACPPAVDLGLLTPRFARFGLLGVLELLDVLFLGFRFRHS